MKKINCYNNNKKIKKDKKVCINKIIILQIIKLKIKINLNHYLHLNREYSNNADNNNKHKEMKVFKKTQKNL